MDWVFQTLGVVREVRDWIDERTGAKPAATLRESPEAAPLPVLPPVGPAAEKTDKKPPKGKPARPERRRTDAPAAVERAPAPDPEDTPLEGSSAAEPDVGPSLPIRQLDRDAVEVVRRLRRFKHESYLVGGCVRDVLVGMEPKDFDVSTSASPEEVKKIFRNSRIIGRRFKLVHIYFRGGKIIETATFRKKASEEDADDLLITHDNVWGTAEEDASRRDFTVNALFYDVAAGHVLDHVGGLEDIERRQLRSIGDPEVRLREDPVRILRAVRFAAKLKFEIEPELRAAMVRHRDDIRRCSSVRVLEETFKLLRGGHAAAAFRVLEETGVLQVILPDFSESMPDALKDAMHGHLEALDGLTRTHESVSDAVVMAALYAPLLEEALGDKPEVADIAEFVGGVADRLGVTKRVREKLRQIFSAQRHLRRHQPGPKPKRRVSPSTLLKRGYFADAVQFFEVRATLGQESPEDLEFWTALAGEAPEPTEEPEQTRRPRRRRRGPRKKDPGATD